MIIGYARVSTGSDEQSISVEAQARQLQAAGCDRVIQERRSAYKEGARRPGWEELQALVAAGAITKVVAVSQSRLSRQDDVTSFLRICSRKGVTVQFLDGTPGDVSDPAARLMTGVLATINAVDSDIKSINVRNGLARRRAAGHYACGRVPFGYLYDGQYVVPHPERFEQAKLLWQRLEASEFNLSQTVRQHRYSWSTRGLRRWIHNPMLRGIVRNMAEQVEALITPQQYANAAALMEGRRERGVRASRRRRLLSGLVRCQQCQRWLHYVMAAGKPRLKCSNILCNWYGRGLAEWKIKQQAIAALEHCHADMGKAAATVPEQKLTQQQLERRTQLEQLLALQEQGVQGLEQSIVTLERQEQLPQPSAPNWQALAILFARPGVLDLASEEELRPLFLEFIDEIVYVGDPNTVEVRLRQGFGSNAP